jgi:hypothetical protein
MRPMTAYSSTARRFDRSFLLWGLFALFWLFVFLRFGLNANILDKIINYSNEGGSIVEKIHPSTYGIVIILTATLLSTRIELDTWELSALRGLIAFASIICAIAVFTVLLGHGGSAGYLVDSYLVACASGALMLFFPVAWREWLGTTVLLYIVAGAFVGLCEFALRVRLLPYPFEEHSFRPTGLSEHPLELGLFNATAINFVAASRWSATAKTAAIVILLVGTIAAGARVATIVAALSTLSVIGLHEWPSTPPDTRLRMKAILFIGIALAIPAVLAVLVQFGLLDRFQNGLIDESGMARVNIYGLFGLTSWSEILFGADISHIRELALQHFDLQFIESAIVMFVFQFGLLGALIFVLFMTRTFLTLLKGAGRHVFMGAAAFFVVAAGNNSLSTKTPIVMMIIMLIIAFHSAEEHIQQRQ